MTSRSILITIVASIVFIGTSALTFDIDIRAKEARAENATSESKWKPTGPVPDRDVYYPGTEALGPDEMRVVALGTGMPAPRPKQAAACWLVELGNGDKFLFDVGAGCHERIAAQKISSDFRLLEH